jgi:hypothetical protein
VPRSCPVCSEIDCPFGGGRQARNSSFQERITREVNLKGKKGVAMRTRGDTDRATTRVRSGIGGFGDVRQDHLRTPPPASQAVATAKAALEQIPPTAALTSRDEVKAAARLGRAALETLRFELSDDGSRATCDLYEKVARQLDSFIWLDRPRRSPLHLAVPPGVKTDETLIDETRAVLEQVARVNHGWPTRLAARFRRVVESTRLRESHASVTASEAPARAREMCIKGFPSIALDLLRNTPVESIEELSLLVESAQSLRLDDVAVARRIDQFPVSSLAEGLRLVQAIRSWGLGERMDRELGRIYRRIETYARNPTAFEDEGGRAARTGMGIARNARNDGLVPLSRLVFRATPIRSIDDALMLAVAAELEDLRDLIPEILDRAPQESTVDRERMRSGRGLLDRIQKECRIRNLQTLSSLADEAERIKIPGFAELIYSSVDWGRGGLLRDPAVSARAKQLQARAAAEGWN